MDMKQWKRNNGNKTLESYSGNKTADYETVEIQLKYTFKHEN